MALPKNKVIVFSSLAVVVVAGIALFMNRARLTALFHRETEEERVAKVLENDKKLLLSGGGRDEEVFGALVRLGDRREVISKQSALRRVEDPSILVRRGAAESLGYFFDDSDSQAALRKMLDDPAPEVRFAVLKAVANRGGPGRLDFLRRLEQDKRAWSDLEKVGIHRGILRLSKPDEKPAAAAPLLALYRSSKDAKVKHQALIDLMAVMPKDPRVLEIVQSDAMKSNDPLLQAQAVRHISAIHDKKLAESLAEMARSPHLPVRMAVVQALGMACPDARFSIVETILEKDENPDVRHQAIEQLGTMAGDQPKVLIERLLAGKTLKGSETSLAKDTLKKIKGADAKTLRCQI